MPTTPPPTTPPPRATMVLVAVALLARVEVVESNASCWKW
jgi:hypothetical protein